MQQNNLEFWIDLNLPPVMAKWLQEDFQVSAKSFKDLTFEMEEDIVVFRKAASRINTIVITTKDIDFKNLVNDNSTPPKILYLNVGNISNKMLKEIIYKSFTEVLRIFSETDNSLIEIVN
jgi:predicted nuclease of predicted toxin-antitoxin system